MAEKHRALAETASAPDRSRFAHMADWWLKRAAEFEAAERS